MANRLSGKVAKVEYGGDAGTASLNNWSIDINTNMLDVTSFTTGTLQWRSFIAGLSDWSGTIAGFSDSSSTGLDTIRTNTLTPTTAQMSLASPRLIVFLLLLVPALLNDYRLRRRVS